MNFDLAAWRHWCGLSQRELGDLAKLSCVAVADLERGEHMPNPSTLKSLAAVFGVPRSVLLHESPSEAWAQGWRPPRHDTLVQAGTEDAQERAQ